MQEYKIILTWESIYDVAEIAEYIEERFSKDDADKFQNSIREEFQKIASNTRLYAQTYILYRGYNIHKKIFAPSLIFYIVKDEEREVHILRALRSEREWKKILGNQCNYSYPEK